MFDLQTWWKICDGQIWARFSRVHQNILVVTEIAMIDESFDRISNPFNFIQIMNAKSVFLIPFPW